MRAPLTFVLLLHYLLVGVLGSAWATLDRQQRAPTAARPYVHSVLCQSHNSLRLDCFDACNGSQTDSFLHQLVDDDHGHTGAPKSFKAKLLIDTHLLAAAVPVFTRPRYVRASRHLAEPLASRLAAGILNIEGPPPKVRPAFAG